MSTPPASGFWHEVRHRHLIPVVTAWFGLCWALIEFSSFMAERYAAPEVLVDAVFMGMWSLLPTVLLVSWWIGETGAMRWTRGRAMTSILLVVSGLLLAWQATSMRGPQEVATEREPDVPADQAAASPGVPRLVLFPFKVQSEDGAERWLGDAASILTAYDLMFDPRFDVAAAGTKHGGEILTSVRALGGTDLDAASTAMLRSAARANAYNVMLTGKIGRSTSGLSLRASLQGLNPDRDLGSFEIEAGDIWDAVDQLAAWTRAQLAVADDVRPVEDPPLASVTTESAQALQAFVEASRAGLQDNDAQAATALLEQAISADANFVAADYLRFQMLSRAGKRAESDAIIQSLVPRLAMLPDRHRFSLQGYQAFAAGDMTKVRAIYALWAKKTPYDREPQRMLAFLDLRAAADDESAWDDRYRLAEESGSARELVGLSRSAMLRDQPDRAITLAQLARQRDPQLVDVPMQLAEIAKSAGRFDDARTQLDEAALMRPELISPVLGVAGLLFDTGKWDQALAEVAAARARSAQNPAARSDVLRREIALLKQLGRWRAAYELLDDLADAEAAQIPPSALPGRLWGHAGLHARIAGIDATRSWIGQWLNQDDDDAVHWAMINIDLAVALQQEDLDAFLDVLARMESAYAKHAQPLPPTIVIYRHFAQAWESGSTASIHQLETAIDGYRNQLAVLPTPDASRDIDQLHEMLIEVALLHQRSETADAHIAVLQRAQPRRPDVLWLTLRAALLRGDRDTAKTATMLLRQAWQAADADYGRAKELESIAADL